MIVVIEHDVTEVVTGAATIEDQINRRTHGRSELKCQVVIGSVRDRGIGIADGCAAIRVHEGIKCEIQFGNRPGDAADRQNDVHARGNVIGNGHRRPGVAEGSGKADNNTSRKSVKDIAKAAAVIVSYCCCNIGTAGQRLRGCKSEIPIYRRTTRDHYAVVLWSTRT